MFGVIAAILFMGMCVRSRKGIKLNDPAWAFIMRVAGVHVYGHVSILRSRVRHAFVRDLEQKQETRDRHRVERSEFVQIRVQQTRSLVHPGMLHLHKLFKRSVILKFTRTVCRD